MAAVGSDGAHRGGVDEVRGGAPRGRAAGHWAAEGFGGEGCEPCLEGLAGAGGEFLPAALRSGGVGRGWAGATAGRGGGGEGTRGADVQIAGVEVEEGHAHAGGGVSDESADVCDEGTRVFARAYVDAGEESAGEVEEVGVGGGQGGHEGVLEGEGKEEGAEEVAAVGGETGNGGEKEKGAGLEGEEVADDDDERTGRDGKEEGGERKVQEREVFDRGTDEIQRRKAEGLREGRTEEQVWVEGGARAGCC